MANWNEGWNAGFICPECGSDAVRWMVCQFCGEEIHPRDRKETSMNPDFYDNAMAQWERQLTEPQQRLLAEVRAKGTVTKNGRIAKTARALVRAGLVVATWEPVAHANSMPTERWTITLR